MSDHLKPILQVMPSDVGATIPGVTQDNVRQFIFELVRASASGQLNTEKFPIAVQASGIEFNDTLSLVIADALWYVWVEMGGPDEEKTEAEKVSQVDEEPRNRLKEIALVCMKEKMVRL